MNTGCEFAHDDAAYVLGALSPDDRLAFERHLAGCSSCRRAVQGLAGMPGLLAQVTPDAVLSPPVTEPVPDTLLPRLDREVRRAQVRRSWVSLAAAAAVVILATAIGVLAVTWGNDDGGPPVAAPTSEPVASEPAGQPMHRVGQDVVNGTVAMTSVAWGTKLDLTCSYDPAEHAYEPPPIWTYALVVRTKDGGVEQVGTWKAIPGKTLSLTAATATDAQNIASLEVLAPDGTPVLRLTT